MRELFEEYRDLIPDFNSFLEILRTPLPIHLRVNTIKSSPFAVTAMLAEKGVELKPAGAGDETLFEAPRDLLPGKLLEYFLGYIHPQALSSCMASLVLSPKPDSSVLDLCAAPGGKTSHLAQIMSNSGLIVANELHLRRHAPLTHTLSRLGVLNSVLTAYAAQEFPLRESFDFVMADVPCSGEGRWRLSRALGGREASMSLNAMAAAQRKMILRGFDLLRKEGIMLYSTCTYNPSENEGILDFLFRHRDAELVDLENVPGTEPGVTHWRKDKFDERVRRARRFYPHRINSVGFFMAKIRRRA